MKCDSSILRTLVHQTAEPGGEAQLVVEHLEHCQRCRDELAALGGDPPTHPEMLGRIGRYDVESLLGHGGMGVALRAHDSDLHHTVAVKVLAPQWPAIRLTTHQPVLTTAWRKVLAVMT